MRDRAAWLFATLILMGSWAGCRRGALDPMGTGSGKIVGAAGAPGTGGGPGDAPGTAGVSGTGGEAGADGTCTFAGVTTERPSNCGAALCGNGVRDTCTWSSACGDRTIAEFCDGAAPGEASCLQQGYASGELSCTASCTLDTTACSECFVPLDVAFTCADVPVSASPWTLRMAATDSEIGLLWLSPADGQHPATLDFARLSPDLRLLSSTRIEGEELIATVGTSRDFGVAPSPSGWIVSGWGETGIFIHALDATGVDRGRTAITGIGGGSLAEGPLLVPRSDGPPLVAVVNLELSAGGERVGVLYVAPIAADGLSTGPARALRQEDWTQPHGFTFAGDAFHAAIVTRAGQIRVQRIETDGTPTTVIDALPGLRATSVAPVGCDGSLCLVFGGPVWPPNDPVDEGFGRQKIGATGAAVGDVTMFNLHKFRDYAWVLPVEMAGVTAVVLGGSSDDLVGVSRTRFPGEISTEEVPITRYPGQKSFVPAVAARGSELLVAWGPAPKGRIRIARVGVRAAP